MLTTNVNRKETWEENWLPDVYLTMRREARVDALSVVIVVGTTIGGSCIFDGDTISTGLALSLTSAPAFEATTN